MAHELSTLDNKNQHIGMGMMGELKPHERGQVLDFVKNNKMRGLDTQRLLNPQKVAVFATGCHRVVSRWCRCSGRDLSITIFGAEHERPMDIGHYESEQHTKPFSTYLKKNS